MMKTYKIGGLTYQYQEGHQPKDAVLVEDQPSVKGEAKPEPRAKAVKPKNK